jgi:hypothetical protein
VWYLHAECNFPRIVILTRNKCDYDTQMSDFYT